MALTQRRPTIGTFQFWVFSCTKFSLPVNSAQSHCLFTCPQSPLILFNFANVSLFTAVTLFCPFLSSSWHTSLPTPPASFLLITMIEKSIQTQDTLRVYYPTLCSTSVLCSYRFCALVYIYTQFWRENIPLLLETKYTRSSNRLHILNLPENTFEGGAEECSHYRRWWEGRGIVSEGWVCGTEEISGKVASSASSTVQIRIQNATDVIA